LPDPVVQALKHDERSDEAFDFQFEGVIPPECIVGHEKPTRDEEEVASLNLLLMGILI
jgi:hypothetical protein